MKLTRIALLLLFPLLSACYQTQLVGNTGESTVTVTDLRTGAAVTPAFNSWGPDAWIDLIEQDVWDSYGPVLQLNLVGMAIPSLDGLEADKLYLITASGGSDYDAGGDLVLDAAPTAVQGVWHAVVSGERLAKRNIKVSALTEAAYQLVQKNMDLFSDQELMLQLDAAATMLVEDVTDDGTVDYNDLLIWSRSLDSTKYRRDLAVLDQLASAITTGQPQDMLADYAEDVFGRDVVTIAIADFGNVVVETLNWDAPITAANFLEYVESGFYDGIIFHRVINNFMIQTGWLELVGANNVAIRTPGDSILNESRVGLINQRGTLSMARTSNPDSASSQFFINQVNNSFLNHGTAQNPDGYAVFANVLSGMDVVDSIATLPTTFVSGIGNDVPNAIVLIESARVTN